MIMIFSIMISRQTISSLMIDHLHIDVLLLISVKVVLQLMEGRTPFLRRSDVDIHWNTHKLLLIFGMGIANNQFSDVYALGRVLKQINDKFLKIPFVASQGSLCTTYLCSKRPTMANLYIAMHNMFQI